MPDINERMATCPLKQYIREHLWETYIAKLNKKPIKYLTLYCPPLTDVKHFTRKGYINFNNNTYQGVVGVTLPDKPDDPNGNESAYAQTISEGKGRLELLSIGYLNKLITSKNKELLDQFPFDVINLDYCDHIFGDVSTDDLSDNLLDIEQIIKQQARKNVSQFVIFITTRTDKHSSQQNQGFAQSFVDNLSNRIQRNINQDDKFKSKYNTIFNNLTVRQLHTQKYNDFISIGIVKLVLMELADKGYGISDCDISFLTRDGSQPILDLLHLALFISRYTGTQRQTLSQYGRVSYYERGSGIVLDKVRDNKIISISERTNRSGLETQYGLYLKE